jgi:hypothetical protein
VQHGALGRHQAPALELELLPEWSDDANVRVTGTATATPFVHLEHGIDVSAPPRYGVVSHRLGSCREVDVSHASSICPSSKSSAPD